MNRNFILYGLMLLMLLLSYCGSARRGTPTHAPLSIEKEAVANGETIFMSHCNKCHPGGAAGLGPAINNKPLPGFLIKYQVRKGFGMMPAFKEDHLSDQELDNLVAYLKELKAAK